MKHISKITILGIFAISAFNSLSFCEESGDSSQLKYLELRGLNYDYVHFYKKSEDYKDKEEYQKSQENALQYKKKLNSYLIKSPNIKSLQDPNGYFSSDEKLGYNPLKQESINSLFKAKPYLVENGSHFYVSKQKDEFSELDMEEPHELEEISGFSDADFEIELDEESFAFDEDGLPLIENDDTSDFSAKSSAGSGLNGDQGFQERSIQSKNLLPGDEESSESLLPGDEDSSESSDQVNPKQVRFDKGINKLHRGVTHFTKAINHLNIAMKKYKEYIHSDSVHPDKVTHMRDCLQMQISRLHRLNGVLRGYGHGLGVAGENNDLEGLQQLHEIHKQQLATENMLDNETQNFENLMAETGNAYRFMPPETVNTAFIPKDEDGNPSNPDITYGDPPLQDNNPDQKPTDPASKPNLNLDNPSNEGVDPTTKPVQPRPVDLQVINLQVMGINPANQEMSGQKPANPNSNEQKPNTSTTAITRTPVKTIGAEKPVEKPTNQAGTTPGINPQVTPVQDVSTTTPIQANVEDRDTGKSIMKIPCLIWPGMLQDKPKPDFCL
jgi:hypothetical protein